MKEIFQIAAFATLMLCGLGLFFLSAEVVLNYWLEGAPLWQAAGQGISRRSSQTGPLPSNQRKFITSNLGSVISSMA